MFSKRTKFAMKKVRDVTFLSNVLFLGLGWFFLHNPTQDFLLNLLKVIVSSSIIGFHVRLFFIYYNLYVLDKLLPPCAIFSPVVIDQVIEIGHRDAFIRQAEDLAVFNSTRSRRASDADRSPLVWRCALLFPDDVVAAAKTNENMHRLREIMAFQQKSFGRARYSSKYIFSGKEGFVSADGIFYETCVAPRVPRW